MLTTQNVLNKMFLIYSYKKYVLRANYMSGPVLDNEVSEQQDRILPLMGLTLYGGKP